MEISKVIQKRLGQAGSLNAAIAANVGEGGNVVSSESKDEQRISQRELDAQDGEQLPDREAMSLVNANVAVPVNAAVAANVLSDNATAIADATQQAGIEQGN